MGIPMPPTCRRGMPRPGQKTESVYRRYAIVSDAALQEATRRVTGTISGTQTSLGLTPTPQPHRIPNVSR